MKTHLSKFLPIAAAVAMASSSHADVIVSIGGTGMATGPGSMNITAGNFKDTTASGYTSPTGNYTQTPFYGGYIRGSSASSSWSIADNTPDFINHAAAASSTGLVASAVFAQADWDIYTTGAVSLSANNAFSVSLSDNSGSGWTGEFRWLIKNGTGSGASYYLSSAVSGFNAANISSTLGTPTTITSGTTSGISWFSYAPVSPLGGTGPLTMSSTVGGSATPDLNAITAVGYYLALDTTGASARNVRIEGLTINAVPEPTTWALLAGSLTTLVIFRRRRRD